MFLRETFLLMELKQTVRAIPKRVRVRAKKASMMEPERWAKYFATCNTIECFSELIKIA